VEEMKIGEDLFR